MRNVVSKPVVATVLALASAPASAQSPVTQEQFREHAVCVGYWKIMTQCLPMLGFPQKQQEEIRQTFEELQSAANIQTEWLGDRSQVPPNSQQLQVEQARQRLFSSIGGRCENAMKLIPTHRDKCAALFKSTTARMVSEHDAKKRPPSDAPPVRDVEMDCTGTLEDSDDTSKKEQATANVRIFGGYVTAIIKPYGMVMGPINKTETNYVRFSVQTSTFTINGRRPTVGGVDRVNARVSIMLIEPKNPNSYVFWFDCKVRKPQF